MQRNTELRKYIEAALKDTSCTLTHIVTAVSLPTGATEVAINTERLYDKLAYILSAYDEDMHLKSNPSIEMVDAMILGR